MLASEPPSSRVHGISVRVNGTTVAGAAKTNDQHSISEDSPRFPVGGDSEMLAECRAAGWAEATITWRTGAQPPDVPNNNSKKSGGFSSHSLSSYDAESQASQLVHVIRVQNTAQNPLQDSCSVTENSNGDMERKVSFTTSNSHTAKTVTPARIRITSNSNNSYKVEPPCSDDFEFCKDKISVVVGPSLNHIVKGEDERSSSGASSAPGSDCERSDSDRELDDGTDSGFSSARRHRANIMVNTKNSNTCNNHSYFTNNNKDVSSNSGITKVPVVCSGKENVKLTIASYSDKELNDNRNSYSDTDNPWDMHFHLRELDATPLDKKQDTEDVQTKIAAAHALVAGQGGMFSLKNRVQSSIVSLLVQSASNRNYEQEEDGRVVFYTSTLGVIRNTHENCQKVKRILENLLIRFEERDLFMNRRFQDEIRERLGTSRVVIPQVFVEGRLLGGVEMIEQLNEMGQLRDILRCYKRRSVGVCQQCGGYRYLLCPDCSGSKKSTLHRHHFSGDHVALRCVTCDESGLIRCPRCVNGEG